MFTGDNSSTEPIRHPDQNPHQQVQLSKSKERDNSPTPVPQHQNSGQEKKGTEVFNGK